MHCMYYIMQIRGMFNVDIRSLFFDFMKFCKFISALKQEMNIVLITTVNTVELESTQWPIHFYDWLGK